MTAPLSLQLGRLLSGEFSSLSLEFNAFSVNYVNARQAEEHGMLEYFDWINEDEHELALNQNTVWVLHWYPNSPVAFRALGAADLDRLLEHIATEALKAGAR